MGICYDEPFNLYRSKPGLNKSSIDKLLQCPAAYKAMLSMPNEPTAAMRLGTAVHAMVLEPDKAKDQIYVTKDLRTKTGKAERDEAIAAGKEVVSLEEYNTAQEMVDGLHAHEACKWLLSQPGKSEVSIYWAMPTPDGEIMPCKARIDRIITLPNGQRLALDLKTSQTSNPLELPTHCARYGYHRQAAWYMKGLKEVGMEVGGFVFLFVEKAAPHLCTPLQLDQSAIALGMQECERAMKTLRECETSGKWPCYTSGIITANLPGWYYKQEQDAAEMAVA